MEGRQMSNDISTTTGNSLSFVAPESVTFVDIRRNSERYPRIRAVKRDIAIRYMAAIVQQACLYKNTPADLESIRFTATALLDELLDAKSIGADLLSFAEIQRVVKRAVLNKDLYISVASLFAELRSYCLTEGHAANVTAMQKGPLEPGYYIGRLQDKMAQELINKK